MASDIALLTLIMPGDYHPIWPAYREGETKIMVTQQPRHSETSANYALGDLLRSMLPGWTIRPETTQVFTKHPGRHADVLITAPGRTPVAVEAEYMSAREVEQDARARLGLAVVGEPRSVEAVIALRYPRDAQGAYDLGEALAGAKLSWCVFYKGAGRFPQSGWLEGSVGDLADLIRLVSVPQRDVDESALALERAIDGAVAILDEMAELRPNVTPAIARLLGLSDVPQTRRMACAIVANAVTFQGRLHGIHDGVKSLRQTAGEQIDNPQRETLAAWDDILKINYWPIFAVARDVVEQLPADAAARILRRLMLTAESINAAGAHIAHDLTGRVFQRLIADRKYLATFYTLPASAALLARLAVAVMDGVDWSDPNAIGALRIADFACGTGALLSAVYEQISLRHEQAGGDAALLHPMMMEEVLFGCDVMPSAIHITGATLAGAQPAVGYGNSRIYCMPYGRLRDGSVAIGSLEYLTSNAQLTLSNYTDPARRTGSLGEETAAQIMVEVPHESCDLVIMNPPFTRATNHEGAHADITNPAFAAFDATSADQTAMGSRINRLGRDTCYHGNAGIASAFAALADRKLKPGGVLALVLPLSAAAGLSWQGFRQMLADGYTDLTVLSIAANGRDMSFSSDTGMAECLVTARKLRPGETPARRGQFVSLNARPTGFAESAALAATLIGLDWTRSIEDGPYGGTRLQLGAGKHGETISAPLPSDGGNWSSVRLRNYTTAQVAYTLTQSQLRLPTRSRVLELAIAPLGEVGQMGLVHRDITGPAPRGPFDKIDPNPMAPYPSLWNHNARQETRIVCQPDSQLEVRQGMESKAEEVWATASRAHLNLDFRFNSQPLAAAFTEQKSIGGRGWPNVIFDDQRFDYAFTVWSNCTLGLLCYWWHSNRQQPGRGITTIRAAESLPALDLRTLSDGQLAVAEAIFEEFRERELQPAYLADADPNRALLDRRVICDLLRFDEETYQLVRRRAESWCMEPSVHGGKARPKDAKFVT